MSTRGSVRSNIVLVEKLGGKSAIACTYANRVYVLLKYWRSNNSSRPTVPYCCGWVMFLCYHIFFTSAHIDVPAICATAFEVFTLFWLERSAFFSESCSVVFCCCCCFFRFTWLSAWLQEGLLGILSQFEMDWANETCVEWFPFVCWSAKVLNIPAREVTPAKRASWEIEVNWFVGLFSVKYKSRLRKILEEARNAVSVVFSFLMDVPDPAAYIPFIDDDIYRTETPHTLC